jgi:triacylglycerol lipase
VGGAVASTSSSGAGGAGAWTTTTTSAGSGGQGAAPALGGPPYAVVLAHGFFGADSWAGLDFLQYFYEVRQYLGDRGETQIYTPSVDPFNSSEVRGAQLTAAIAEIRILANSDKVNIIGHSQGGLDARLVAHEHPEWVASVVTFATPHQGSRIADVALGEEEDPNYLGVLESLLATVGRSVWDQWGEETSLATALRSFTTGALVEFNAVYTDQPSVYYASFAGRSDRHAGGPLCTGALPDFVAEWADTLDPVDAALAVPEMVLDGGLGAGYPNDGLVTVESARWGRFLGCLPADHIDEVGQVLGDSPGLGNDWDHRQFYADVVALLRERGL